MVLEVCLDDFTDNRSSARPRFHLGRSSLSAAKTRLPAADVLEIAQSTRGGRVGVWETNRGSSCEFGFRTTEDNQLSVLGPGSGRVEPASELRRLSTTAPDSSGDRRQVGISEAFRCGD